MKANLLTGSAAGFSAVFLSAEPCLTFASPLIRLRGATDMMELLFRRRDHISPRAKFASSTGIPAHVSSSHRHARAKRRELPQRRTKNYFASLASCVKCITNISRDDPVPRRRKNLQRLPARFSHWVSTKLRQRRLSCKVHCKAFRHLQAMQIWIPLTFALLSVFRPKSKSCISAVEARNRVCRAYSLDSLGPPRRRLADDDSVGTHRVGESEGEQSSAALIGSVGNLSCLSVSSSTSGSSSAGYVTAASDLSLSDSSFYSVGSGVSSLRSGDGSSSESSFPTSSDQLDGHDESPRCSLCLEIAAGGRGGLDDDGDDWFIGSPPDYSEQDPHPLPGYADVTIGGAGGLSPCCMYAASGSFTGADPLSIGNRPGTPSSSTVSQPSAGISGRCCAAVLALTALSCIFGIFIYLLLKRRRT